MSLKRREIEQLSKDYSDKSQYVKQLYKRAKRWKQEIKGTDPESVLKKNMSEYKKSIEAFLKKRWNETRLPDQVVTVDLLDALFQEAVKKEEVINEWIALPLTWKDRFWGSCCFRDLGGSCNQTVTHLCAILPRSCTGGNDMHDGGQHQLSMFYNEFDENFICKKHYSERHRFYLYKRLFLPDLCKSIEAALSARTTESSNNRKKAPLSRTQMLLK